MKKEPYGYVYKITNKVNSKTYIGQRKLSRDSSWRAYLGSGKLIQQAVSKYGSEKFIKTFICYAYDSDELSDVEYKIIKNEKMIGKCEYNINSNVPDPVSRLKSSPERLKEAEEKRAKGRKAYLKSEESYHKANIRNNAKKYEAIFAEIGDEIIADYKEIGSTRKVAEKHSLPKNRVHDFIKSQGVELNYQNIEGRKVSEEQKLKISQSTKKFFDSVNEEGFCKNCGKSFIKTTANKILCTPKCKGK